MSPRCLSATSLRPTSGRSSRLSWTNSSKKARLARQRPISRDAVNAISTDGPPFIDTLFTVLRTKSYIPYASALAPSTSQISAAAGGDDAGIPIPLDAIMSPPIPTGPSALRKRALEDGGDGNAPAKGPRLGNFPNGRHDRRDYNPMENGMGHVNPSRNVAGRPKIHIPPEQLNGICRDYHGKCSLS